MELPHIFLPAFVLCITLSCSVTKGYRILGVFPHVSKSHFVMNGIIMRDLAARGHEVVVISPFPEKNQLRNYKDITYLNPENVTAKGLPLEMVSKASILFSLYILYIDGVETCEATYSSHKVQELLKSNEEFDLIIMELFDTDCFLPFAHIFNSSVVGISTSALMPWANGRFGNPDNPSYIPVQFSKYTDRMTFPERLVNSLILSSAKLLYNFAYNYKANQIARRYLGESVPTVQEMANKINLLLVNSHFAIHQPRPLVPAVVEVGGIHVKKPKATTKEFETFLNDAEHGVIYFSMGSTIRTDSFPEPMRKAFLEAFSELPQRVLWKWESDSMPGQPKNVKIAKWMQQSDILSHPNVKVFITHGGLLGTMEAAYFGVPMIAIPMLGDQHHNVRSYVQKGIAVKLDYETIDKQTVSSALKEILQNSSYAENAKRVAAAFRDAPMSPLDTAIYWIEYVIRHQGAAHLRSSAADMPWYQLCLLDVIAVLLLAATVCLVLLLLLLRAVVNKVFGRKKQQPVVKRNKPKSKTS